MGPSKKLAGDLNELDCHKNNNKWLCQGCKHEHQVLFGVSREWKAKDNFLRKVTTYQAFLQENISSLTGVMVEMLAGQEYCMILADQLESVQSNPAQHLMMINFVLEDLT